jgi:hypothetical protein
MMKRGNTRKEDGGLTIATPLDYAVEQHLPALLRLGHAEHLAVGRDLVAEYQWRQIAINVVASGRELRINSGDSRIINLAKARVKNAIRTFNNNFSSTCTRPAR